jgi:hypothetical protein
MPLRCYNNGVRDHKYYNPKFKKRKENFMEGVKEIQEAIQTSRQAPKPDYPKWLNEGPKSALDYIDLIIDRNSKLARIIGCLAGYPAENADMLDFDRLGAAMLDFTDAIEKHVKDFHKYLGEIGAYSLEKPLNPADK